jgi:hypothetical protein
MNRIKRAASSSQTPAAASRSRSSRNFLEAQVPEKQISGLLAAWPYAKNAVLCLHEALAAPYLCIIKQQSPTGRAR